MKTIKLPYKTEYDLVPLMRQYSSVVRYTYRRFLKGKTEKEVRNLTKQKDSILKHHKKYSMAYYLLCIKY